MAQHTPAGNYSATAVPGHGHQGRVGSNIGVAVKLCVTEARCLAPYALPFSHNPEVTVSHRTRMQHTGSSDRHNSQGFRKTVALPPGWSRLRSYRRAVNVVWEAKDLPSEIPRRRIRLGRVCVHYEQVGAGLGQLSVLWVRQQLLQHPLPTSVLTRSKILSAKLKQTNNQNENIKKSRKKT